MLQSVLRLKEIQRMKKLEELAHANAQLEQCVRVLSQAKEREERARTTLWQTMTDESLCVQRMALARTEESASRAARERASAAHDESEQKRDDLAEFLARLEKEIEKLGERVERERLEKLQELQKKEWQAIDESVINLTGASR